MHGEDTPRRVATPPRLHAFQWLIFHTRHPTMESMQQKRAYKYRFYPTEEQQRILAKTFGCVRYIYNWALCEHTDRSYQQGERWSYAQMSAALTALKKQDDHHWLKEVSSVPVQQALRHLDQAFLNFFEGRAQYPTCKKKRTDQAAEYTRSAFQWDGKYLTLAKMHEPLAIRWSRLLPEGAKPTTITITKDSANRYFVSFLLEEEIKPLPVTPHMIGLDLGIKSMVVSSDGHTYGNPKFFAKDEKKLARAQRRHAKKTERLEEPRKSTAQGRSYSCQDLR